MIHPAPADPSGEPRYTSQRYFSLVDEGVLAPDDRGELLEGVIVSVAPQSPSHAGVTERVAEVLRRAVGNRALVREDKPLVLAPRSVPEADVMVVPGRRADYLRAHPTTALLVVEVAESSLPQDRITKARIYAAAGIPEYWIVDLRDRRIEIYREPDVQVRRYLRCTTAGPGEEIELLVLPDVRLSTDELLPEAEDG
jgi:Uma2 family endonuclease